MPPEIQQVLEKVFKFPQTPCYIQLASAAKDGKPSLRTMRLQGVADEDKLIFYTHTGTLKWRNLLENPRASVCFIDGEQKNQILASGKVKLISGPAGEAKEYWDKLPDDDKKLYSSPETFGIIVFTPEFWELLQVDFTDITKSKRVKYELKGTRWEPEPVTVR